MDNKLPNEKKDAKSALDELANQCAHWRKMAVLARRNVRNYKVTPVETLMDYFLSICHAGERYDRDLRIRTRLIRFLPDYKLVFLLGVQMPPKLARQIEIRLCPRCDKSWGPNVTYFDDFFVDD